MKPTRRAKRRFSCAWLSFHQLSFASINALFVFSKLSCVERTLPGVGGVWTGVRSSLAWRQRENQSESPRRGERGHSRRSGGVGLNRRGWPAASPEVDANLGASSNALEEAEESLSWEVYCPLTLKYFWRPRRARGRPHQRRPSAHHWESRPQPRPQASHAAPSAIVTPSALGYYAPGAGAPLSAGLSVPHRSMRVVGICR